MVHLPILRWGCPYRSLDVQPIADVITGEPIATISTANPGLVQRDLLGARVAADALRRMPVDALVDALERAADLYRSATLPLGDESLSIDQFVHVQAATSGIPESFCRGHVDTIAWTLQHTRDLLDALGPTDPRPLASAASSIAAATITYQPQADAVGVVLPSNSPGVHTLWLPLLPLRFPVVLKPGSNEPWTPYRLAAALRASGIPHEAIAIYPGHAPVASAIVDGCGRAVVFGGADTAARFDRDPRIQMHGPGFSKIVFGDDEVDRWEAYLDVLVESIVANAGRSCTNCSSIWASRHTTAMADALAARLADVPALPPADPSARLAALPVGGAATAISAAIDADLAASGAVDVTARRRRDRRATVGRAEYLLPTIVHCDGPESPLARREYMFPFAAVVRCGQERVAEAIGPTLVCTAITADPALRRALAEHRGIDRLNLGPIPTTAINRLQPHQGNLVDFLFRPMAVQLA